MKNEADIFFEIVEYVKRARITKYIDLVWIAFEDPEDNKKDWRLFLIDHYELIRFIIEKQ